MNFLTGREGIMAFRFSLVLMAIALLSVSVQGGLAADRHTVTDEILILFNHGSSSGDRGDCYGLVFNPPPQWIRKLDGSTLDGKRVRVIYPCTITAANGDSLKTDYPSDIRGCGDVWVCRRAARIVEMIEVHSAGYPPSHVFVAGHSAGGWASLLIKRWNPNLFNGVIATAPAFNGDRRRRLCVRPGCDPTNTDTEKKRKWRSRMREQHERFLTSGPDLRALVFAFHCDPYGHPHEYRFANAVTIYTYPNRIRGTLRCAVPDTKPRYRHFDRIGSETWRCEKSRVTSRYDSSKPPTCGYDNVDSRHRSIGKIHNCPPSLRASCRLNQHTQMHRDILFHDHLSSTAYVTDFIKRRIADWREIRHAPLGETPCSFVRLQAVCSR